MPGGSFAMRRVVRLARLVATAFVAAATSQMLLAQPAPATSSNTPAQTAQRGAAPYRIGSVVSPDTVQVGDPFILTVTVEVPAGARVTWPTPSDSNGPVSLRAPVRVTGNENGAVRRETAEYDLAVWAIGAVKVPLPDIKVNEQSREIAVPFEAPSIFVQSVLPADTSLHLPKPAKDLFLRVIPWWEKWWPALVMLAVLLLIGWLALRVKRKKLINAPLDPFVRAERDFQRLDRLALNEAGEQGCFVALALEVLRTYLSVRIPAASLALTSDELLLAVGADSRVPTQRLAPLLTEGDTIKFGRYFVDGSHARELALEARGVVSAVEQAEQARRAAERAQEKARKRAKRKEDVEAQVIAEEKARLESRRGKSEAA